jgi:hypothetical protein
VEREKALKPYARVSRIEWFEGMIMANKVTAEGGTIDAKEGDVAGGRKR